MLLTGIPLRAESNLHIRTISAEEADSLARIQVVYRDRIVPFQTVARDVTLKLTGKTHISSMNDVRFVASLILYPSDWVTIPIFKVKDKQLADSLGVEKNTLVSMSQLFNNNEEYKLKKWYKGGDKGLDKAILDLDEKVEIILMLRTNSLFTPLSSELSIQNEDLKPLSTARVSLEIFFNKLGIVRWLFIPVFSLFFLYLLVSYFSRNEYIGLFLRVLILFLCLIATFNFISRWIIGEHIPLAGGEQVMMFMTMLTLWFSFLFSLSSNLMYRGSRNWILILGTLLMSGFTALVARISSADPIVTGISPALASPWLAFHVSIIMASYAVLAMILPLSIIGEFIKPINLKKLLPITFQLNLIGVILLGIGIILGSLWAKGAWGSYWSWDPKENWAAITFLAYLLPLCFSRYFKQNPRFYNVVLICAFGFMIVTYFGVNYMTSLHSYGY